MASNNLASAVRGVTGAMRAVNLMVGTFVSTDGVRGMADVGGGRIPVDLGVYQPEVGESVFIQFINHGTALVYGPTTLKPDRGTVTVAPSGGFVTVSTVAGTLTLPYLVSQTLTVGMNVKIMWSNGAFVMGQMSISPASAPAPAPPAAVYRPTDHTQIFTATDSGSYRLGAWWTTQVYASDNNTGAWFYGTKIANTIPDSAGIKSAEIYVSASQIYGYPPNFTYHYSGTKPSGNVTPAGSLWPTTIRQGWVGLPTAIVSSYLRTNVGGIAVNHGGYNIFRSLAQDSLSGALRITWNS